MSTRERLLADIEAYLSRSGMSATTFGVVVLRNTRFVHDLRKGQAVKDYTIDKVNAWLKANKAKPKRCRSCAA